MLGLGVLGVLLDSGQGHGLDVPGLRGLGLVGGLARGLAAGLDVRVVLLPGVVDRDGDSVKHFELRLELRLRLRVKLLLLLSGLVGGCAYKQ